MEKPGASAAEETSDGVASQIAHLSKTMQQMTAICQENKKQIAEYAHAVHQTKVMGTGGEAANNNAQGVVATGMGGTSEIVDLGFGRGIDPMTGCGALLSQRKRDTKCLNRVAPGCSRSDFLVTRTRGTRTRVA